MATQSSTEALRVILVTRPLPPVHLSSRIGGAHADYRTIGAAHAHHLRSALPADWSFEGKRVLDFGCGTGRTLVQFADEAERAEFWGCDIDAPSVEWAAKNLSPPFHFVANDELPPVDLPGGTFDLIFGYSVFTHLLETWADWAVEMHRLLAVGGYGFFTFLGEGMVGTIIGRPWEPERIGMIELDPGRPWSIGGPNALHSDWWLRAHWGRLFNVVDVISALDPVGKTGHGVLVVRKDERPAVSADDLRGLEPHEPREAASLQYNVELLKEKLADFWRSDTATLRKETEFLRSELAKMAGSKSWKLTQPLRHLRSRVRRG
jgi:SAM-dependent methyltransferase